MTSKTTPAFATRAVHAGASPDPTTGARATPIYQTNGFAFESVDHGAEIFALRKQGFAYSRASNPTNATLERRIASLEGGEVGIAAASGQSAWLIVMLTLLASGDEYVGSRLLFGGSLGLMKRLEQRLNIVCRWAMPTPASIEAAITPRTKAIIIETVINPTGEVVDLPAIAAIAKAHNIPLVVDNTLASPALLRPIEHGANIVIHSASKFTIGNGTAIGGLVVDGGNFNFVGDKRYPLVSEPWEEYDGIVLTEAAPKAPFAAACRLMGMKELGPSMAPILAFMFLNGLETLPLRMEKHVENAGKVAEFLEAHAKFVHVSYPYLASSPTRDVALRICPHGAGCIFMATMKGGREEVNAFISKLKVFSHLVNIGESRSLVSHPASTTHRTLPLEDHAIFGITEGTIRFSVGLEDAEDLLRDLEGALG
jgi:O-acetylhomoserine (thiol)-lyase